MANSAPGITGIYLTKGSGRTKETRVVDTEAQAVAAEFDGFTRVDPADLVPETPKRAGNPKPAAPSGDAKS